MFGAPAAARSLSVRLTASGRVNVVEACPAPLTAIAYPPDALRSDTERAAPETVILSASGLDHSRGLGGITFNVRFGANSLAAEGGVDRLKGLIEAAFDLGTFQVQIDLASTEVLRDAQANPEGYDDLFVRIGGYLVPFTLLCPKAQEDIIARTELEL